MALASADDQYEGVVSWETKGKEITVKGPSAAFVQALYSEITGKTESRGRNFKGCFKISLDNLEQLHIKLLQTLEPLDTKAITSSVEVRHCDSSTQSFSSFDRFKLYNKSYYSPISSIEYEVSALVAVPKNSETQNLNEKYKKYEVSLVITPFVYDRKASDDEMIWIESDFIQFSSIHCRIKFIDFMVSETLLSTIEGWIKTLEKLKDRRTLTFLKKNRGNISGYVSDTMKIIFAAIAFYAFYTISKNEGQFHTYLMTASIFIIFFFIARIAIQTSLFIGLANIRPTNDYVLLDINSGDSENIRQTEQIIERKYSKLALPALSIVASLGLSILANYLSSLLL